MSKQKFSAAQKPLKAIETSISAKEEHEKNNKHITKKEYNFINTQGSRNSTSNEVYKNDTQVDKAMKNDHSQPCQDSSSQNKELLCLKTLKVKFENDLKTTKKTLAIVNKHKNASLETLNMN